MDKNKFIKQINLLTLVKHLTVMLQQNTSVYFYQHVQQRGEKNPYEHLNSLDKAAMKF